MHRGIGNALIAFFKLFCVEPQGSASVSQVGTAIEEPTRRVDRTSEVKVELAGEAVTTDFRCAFSPS